MGQDKVITISRQYGSGGRQIGERLVSRLQIPLLKIYITSERMRMKH